MTPSRMAMLGLFATALCSAAQAAELAETLLPTAIEAEGGLTVLTSLSSSHASRDLLVLALDKVATSTVHSSALQVTGRYGLTRRLSLLAGLAGGIDNSKTSFEGAPTYFSRVAGLQASQLELRYDLLPSTTRDQALTAGARVVRRAQRLAPSVMLQYTVDVVGSTRVSDAITTYLGTQLSSPNEGQGKRHVAAAAGAWFRWDSDVSYRAEVSTRRVYANDTERGMTQYTLELGSIITFDENILLSPAVSYTQGMKSGRKDGEVDFKNDKNYGLVLNIGYQF